MTDISELLGYLSDGEFHSGEDLAKKLNVTRTAIWKQIKKLNSLLPFDIHSIPRKGYKIDRPMTLLKQSEILLNLSVQAVIGPHNLEILFECKSTNQFLLERLVTNQPHNYLVLAEMQTEGRGRRGRNWVSPFASNIYMSLLWTLDISIAEIGGLSLVVAISVAKAIQKCGVSNVMLKWPNDIYVDNKKLAGILLELRGESNSPCNAVIGIGVNVNMPQESGASIEQEWIDMESALKCSINRNYLVSEILNELIPRLQKFNVHGFNEFRDEWNTLDLLAEKSIKIDGHMSLNEGTAHGVDQYGALIVEHEGITQTLYSGEVSIRAT